MTHNEFTHIVESLGALSPEQLRQLRLELEEKLGSAAKQPVSSAQGSLGAMRDAADELDAIVEQAMKIGKNARGDPRPVNKALLDTDIYSEVLKAVDPTVVRNAATYQQQHGVYTLSVVTLIEIVQGFQRSQSAGRLEGFLTAVGREEVLPFDEPSAELAGRISGDLDRVGRPIGRCDPMIAAIAITHGLELVTGNTTHYQRLHQLGYAITLVNWR